MSPLRAAGANVPGSSTLIESSPFTVPLSVPPWERLVFPLPTYPYVCTPFSVSSFPPPASSSILVTRLVR